MCRWEGWKYYQCAGEQEDGDWGAADIQYRTAMLSYSWTVVAGRKK